MSTCAIEGHPEMYGLGIRIAFYIHWFGEILVTHLGGLGLPIVRTSSLVLSMSISLALIIQCAKQTLGPAEIYISLLLGSGMYFPLIPVYMIKCISCCHPNWNAECWLEKRLLASWLKISLFTEAVVVGCSGIWFWTTLVHQRRAIGCPQFGFFFTPVSIKDDAFIVFHALLYAGFIISCGCLGLDAVGCLGRKWRRARKKFRKRDKTKTKLWWKRLYIVSAAAIASITIAAVELSIIYNKIARVDSLSALAQIYPPFFSIIGISLLVLWQRLQDKFDNDPGSTSRTPPVTVSTDGGYPPPPRGSCRYSETDGTRPESTATATHRASNEVTSAGGTTDCGFSPGWPHPQDPNGRRFGISHSQASPPGLDYPARARTVG